MAKPPLTPSTFTTDNSGFAGLTLASAAPDNTVFLPFTLAPDMREELIAYKNAEKLARELDLTQPGAGAYVLVDGTFLFGDFVEALIKAKNYHVRELLIATLSIKAENIDSLRNLLVGGYVERLTFLLADWEFSKHRYTLMPYLVEKLGFDGRLRFAAVRSHCKICLLETHCGRKLILHGSANLVSSGNVEQFEIQDNPARYDFNYRYWNAVATKYNVLNTREPDIRRQRSLTISQTWQPTAVATPRPKSEQLMTAEPLAAAAKPKAAKASSAAPAAAAATTPRGTTTPTTKRPSKPAPSSSRNQAIAGIKQQ